MIVSISQERSKPGFRYWWQDVSSYKDMLELVAETARLLKQNKLPDSWIRKFGEDIKKEIRIILADLKGRGEYVWTETKKNFKRIKPEETKQELVRFEKQGSEAVFDNVAKIDELAALILMQEFTEILAANNAAYFITGGDVTADAAGNDIEQSVEDVLKD